MDEELKKIVDQFPRARWEFEMRVEAAALEVIEIAKQISSAIGDVSVAEAQGVIIKEFAKALNAERSFGEFNARKT